MQTEWVAICTTKARHDVTKCFEFCTYERILTNAKTAKLKQKQLAPCQAVVSVLNVVPTLC